MDVLAALRWLQAHLDLPEDVGAPLWAEQRRLARQEQPIHTGVFDAPVNDQGRVVGERHHSARIPDSDIELILELRDAGLSYGQIAAKFDDDRRIARSTVAAICTGSRRQQTTFGHRRLYRTPTFSPADPDEFDFVIG